MHLTGHRQAVAEPVVTAPAAGAGGTERKEPSAVPGAVRADLEAVFRRDYQAVVGVAARVLGSRDQAEDVAQDVFLSFGRSSVPAAEDGHLADGFGRGRGRAVLHDLGGRRRRRHRRVPRQRGRGPGRHGVADAAAHRRPVAGGDERFQDPAALTLFGGSDGEAFPFLSAAPLTATYLGWAAVWVAMIWGLAAASFLRKDL